MKLILYATQYSWPIFFTKIQEKLINSINLLLKVSKILDVFKTEQDHEHSPYTFVRDTTRKEDTLINDGRGAKQLLQE